MSSEIIQFFRVDIELVNTFEGEILLSVPGDASIEEVRQACEKYLSSLPRTYKVDAVQKLHRLKTVESVPEDKATCYERLVRAKDGALFLSYE